MAGIGLIIIKRLGLGLLTMLMVSILIFGAVNLLPGDFAQAIMGQGATPEAVQAIRRDLGLDQPLVERYFTWLFGVLQGDFGNSFAELNFSSYGGTTASANFGSVADKLAPRFNNTMFLASVTALFAVPVSILIGVLAALYRNSIFDRVANILSLIHI